NARERGCGYWYRLPTEVEWNTLVGEVLHLRKNVHTTSTSPSRPTICPLSRRILTAIFRSARRRKASTWRAPRGSERTLRTSWDCATCMATCGNGAQTPRRGARTG